MKAAIEVKSMGTNTFIRNKIPSLPFNSFSLLRSDRALNIVPQDIFYLQTETINSFRLGYA